jgi:hypothetical protein
LKEYGAKTIMQKEMSKKVRKTRDALQEELNRNSGLILKESL